MYATANLKERYKQDYISTASPADLIIMLYEGCIKKIKLAHIHLESGALEEASKVLINAQDIVTELMKCLDMSFEISRDLMNLYDFILNELIQMNIKKDMQNMSSVLGILNSLKDTWTEAKSKLDNSMVCEQF